MHLERDKTHRNAVHRSMNSRYMYWLVFVIAPLISHGKSEKSTDTTPTSSKQRLPRETQLTGPKKVDSSKTRPATMPLNRRLFINISCHRLSSRTYPLFLETRSCAKKPPSTCTRRPRPVLQPKAAESQKKSLSSVIPSNISRHIFIHLAVTEPWTAIYKAKSRNAIIICDSLLSFAAARPHTVRILTPFPYTWHNAHYLRLRPTQANYG